ncbi:MAG: aminotransferase class V-fold PLP-dependent enzyme [Planctomycetes bacterium]|nr:aminotransferase class V-fold PLP-dependent enzyme [Planctomycetota bacterium]
MTTTSPFARHWDLDPEVTFLNHGSFGACPRVVLAAQSELRARLEREPVRFFEHDYEPLLDAARAALAELVGSDPDDLAFVPNATAGVNTVLRALDFGPGDELLVTDHEYNASRNVFDHVVGRSGARAVTAPLPFPIADPQQVVDAVLSRVTERTRLLLIDHVTSPTGLVLPLERLVPALRERGVETLVDGAHGPGMLPLDLEGLGAAYYTGNCHKWLCTPKGSALLWVRRDRQAALRPLAISHGANSPRTDRSQFRLDFDWTGTHDPTPFLCLPAALEFLRGLMPGGLPALQAHNRELVLRGRQLLCERLGIPEPAPAAMIGSLAALPLPLDATPITVPGTDPLHAALYDRYRIEVPVMRWPHPPLRLLRISAQAYNSVPQYEALAEAVAELGC